MFMTQSPMSDDEMLVRARALFAESKRLADKMEADPEAHLRASIDAFLESPPNPSDIRRSIAEAERLDDIIGPSVRQIDRESGTLSCNWCGKTLSPGLKWALVPLIVTDDPKSTLACMSCLEQAYVLPDRQARLKALTRPKPSKVLGLERTELVSGAPGLLVFVLTSLALFLGTSESLLGSMLMGAFGGLMAQAIGYLGLAGTTYWVAHMARREPSAAVRHLSDDPLTKTPALLLAVFAFLAGVFWS